MLSPRHAVQTTRHDRDLHAPAARGLPATLPTRARGIALLAAAALSLVLTGCASNPPRSPLPAELAGEAQIPGIPGARYWGDEPPPRLDEWLSWPEQALESSYGGIMDRSHAYLVISGGGGDGAYGAGLLVGWSAHGSRPEFQIVTGVSTGAIIAPFAFLGAAHDSTLREIYTSFASHDLIRRRSLLAVVTGDAAFDTAPLRRLLDRYLDDTHVAAMAAEHRRGRTLLVATTNLDAARPVIWDLTRIAASGRPEAGRLIRDVILASAAIPAAFPPVTFKVTAGGGTYDELHVDGGVTSQLFFGPPGIDWRQVAERLRVQGRPELYLIRNSRLLPRFEPVPREIGPIVTRTLASLIRTQGIGDLARVYIVADRDGLGFNLARIPPTFDATPSEPFDRDYMRELFQLGYEAGRSGGPWLRDPER